MMRHPARIFSLLILLVANRTGFALNTKGAYASKNFSGTIGEGIYHRYHAILPMPGNSMEY